MAEQKLEEHENLDITGEEETDIAEGMIQLYLGDDEEEKDVLDDAGDYYNGNSNTSSHHNSSIRSRRSSTSRRSSVDPDDGVWETFNSEILFERQKRIRTSGISNSLSRCAAITSGTQNRNKRESIKEDDMKRWNTRLRRKDIFALNFVPSQTQAREIRDLSFSLGIRWAVSAETKSDNNCTSLRSSKQKMMSLLRGDSFSQSLKMMKQMDSMTHLTNNKTENSTNDFGPTVSELNDRARSVLNKNAVLLKLGPILLDKGGSLNDWFLRDEEVQPRELIILTNSFLVCTFHISEDGDEMEVTRTLEHCNTIESIVSVIDTEYENKLHDSYTGSRTGSTNDDYSFKVIVESESYTFICAKREQKLHWLEAFKTTILNCPSKLQAGKNDPGWEHDILRIGLHSAARRGDIEMAQNILSDASPPSHEYLDLNMPDSAGNTPVHYAVKNHRISVLEMLLEAGACPDKMNSDCKTPAEFCEKFGKMRLTAKEEDEIKEILEILEEHGSVNAKEIAERNEQRKIKNSSGFRGFMRKCSTDIENMLNQKESA